MSSLSETFVTKSYVKGKKMDNGKNKQKKMPARRKPTMGRSSVNLIGSEGPKRSVKRKPKPVVVQKKLTMKPKPVIVQKKFIKK